MNKIIMIIICVVIFYNVFGENIQKFFVKDDQVSSKDEKDPKFEGSFLEKTSSAVLLNLLKTKTGQRVFEKLLSPIHQNLNRYLAQKDYKIDLNKSIDHFGTVFYTEIFNNNTSERIGPALCGYDVRIKYKILYQGDPKQIVKEETKKITLGKNDIFQEIDVLGSGMRVGETRSSIILDDVHDNQSLKNTSSNSEQSYFDIKRSYNKIFLTLEEVFPRFFLNEKEVRIFDSNNGQKFPFFLCGDVVKISVKVLELNSNTIIVDPKNFGKIDTFIGDQDLPIAVSYAMDRKPYEGVRTIICKGLYLRSVNSYQKSANKLFDKFLINDEYYYLIDIST